MDIFKRTLSAKNVPDTASNEDIKGFFEKSGTVERILYHGTRDCLYILYKEATDVPKAITTLSGEELAGAKLILRSVPFDKEDEINDLIAEADLLPLVDKLKNLPKDHFDRLMSKVNTCSAAAPPTTVVQPRLPLFSGDNNKGEVNFIQWKYHLKCLTQESSIPVHNIMQAIRLSVRGTAADVLMYLGEEADPSSVLNKFETIFGSALSSDQLLMQLFNAKQQVDESVIAWSCRLQQMFSQVKEKSSLGAGTEAMLRSIFYHGLYNRDLANITRHNFESETSFDTLLSQVRKAEFECQPSSSSHSRRVSHHLVSAPPTASSNPSLESKVDKILDTVTSLEKRVTKLEAKDQDTPKCSRCLRFGHVQEHCHATRDVRGRYLNA